MHFIDLFDDYPFFYAAMVWNRNTKAQDRLYGDYNYYADPTCFYDGGHMNLVGGYVEQDPYRDLIIDAGAVDVHDLGLEVSWTWKGGGIIEIYFTVTNNELINNAPIAPSEPIGPSDGNAGTEYQFQASTLDGEDNEIYYMWDWGNGDFSAWEGPYSSGETCTEPYTWFDAGTYDVRVKAKDSWDAESDWSSPLPIDVISFVCGDASGDQQINLLDILYLIAYKYNDPAGPAPDPEEAGDANGDGSVNLLDILYLIANKYNTPPGPDPVCP